MLTALLTYPYFAFQGSDSPTTLHLPSSVVRIDSHNTTIDVEQLSGEEPERIALVFGSVPDMERFSQVGSIRARAV